MITDDHYDNPWTYRGSRFSLPDDELAKYTGFVYLIQGLGKFYIGKKLLWAKKPKSRAKSAPKRQKTVYVPSDWKKYYGSSEELKGLVAEAGWGPFKREILHLCGSKGELNYMELKEQVDRHALLRDDSWNGFVGGKIHRKHIPLEVRKRIIAGS